MRKPPIESVVIGDAGFPAPPPAGVTSEPADDNAVDPPEPERDTEALTEAVTTGKRSRRRE